MAVSRSPRHDIAGSQTDERTWGPTLSRYDLVLTLIPALLLGAALAHVGLGLSLPLALVPASVAGGLLLLDAVFINPPTAPGSGER